MKVLLCCAGGLSSSILMKKMKTWADAHGEDLEIQAMGTGEAVETWQNGYECVLLAPQVSYRLKQLQEEIKLPIAEVPSLDYAIGNAENVMIAVFCCFFSSFSSWHITQEVFFSFANSTNLERLKSSTLSPAITSKSSAKFSFSTAS